MSILKNTIAIEIDDLLEFDFNINLKTLKKQKSYIFIKRFFLTFFIFMLGSILFSPITNSRDLTKLLNKKHIDKTVLTQQMIHETKKYIKTYAPDSKLSADIIVNMCLINRLDICFVLAQGHLESHFGTKGLAKQTNSVFNVGTYDNGVIICTYKTADASVEPYINLLKNHYIKNNINSLFKKYVNKNGYRYASSILYEKYMSTIYSRIVTTTNIQKLQTRYTIGI